MLTGATEGVGESREGLSEGLSTVVVEERVSVAAVPEGVLPPLLGGIVPAEFPLELPVPALVELPAAGKLGSAFGALERPANLASRAN